MTIHFVLVSSTPNSCTIHHLILAIFNCWHTDHQHSHFWLDAWLLLLFAARCYLNWFPACAPALLSSLLESTLPVLCTTAAALHLPLMAPLWMHFASCSPSPHFGHGKSCLLPFPWQIQLCPNKGHLAYWVACQHFDLDGRNFVTHIHLFYLFHHG